MNASDDVDEQRLLEEAEFDECPATTEQNYSKKDSPTAALMKTVESSIEGQFSKLAECLQEGFLNLGTMLKAGQKASRRNPSSSSSSSGSASDSGDKQPPPKRAKKQQLSEDEVTKDVNELISASNQQTKDSPANISSQSTVLAIIADELSEEKCGPEVTENLAKVVDKLLRTKLTEEKLKEKQNLYFRPKNCEAMVPTRVNSEIWQQLLPHTRSQDIRMQKVQGLLLKGLMPLTQLTNTLLQLPEKVTNENRESIVKQALDALTLIAQANGELNQRRREVIKPDLNHQYQQLCNDQVPITSWLFGDELAKTCQDITNTNRVSQKVSGSGSHRPHRNQKYRRHYRFPKNEQGKSRPQSNFPRKHGGNRKAQQQ